MHDEMNSTVIAAEIRLNRLNQHEKGPRVIRSIWLNAIATQTHGHKVRSVSTAGAKAVLLQSIGG